MSREEFLKQQYITLREEIRESKARVFRLLVLGALLVPAAGFAANEYPSTFASACFPFIILIIMLAYIVEQSSIIRAGRYLKEHVEPKIDGVTGWEHWLEGSRRLREVDRSFFGSFVLIFLIFYFVATANAVSSLYRVDDVSYWCGVGGYAVGGLWFVVVLVRYWRFSTTTRA